MGAAIAAFNAKLAEFQGRRATLRQSLHLQKDLDAAITELFHEFEETTGFHIPEVKIAASHENGRRWRTVIPIDMNDVLEAEHDNAEAEPDSDTELSQRLRSFSVGGLDRTLEETVALRAALAALDADLTTLVARFESATGLRVRVIYTNVQELFTMAWRQSVHRAFTRLNID